MTKQTVPVQVLIQVKYTNNLVTSKQLVRYSFSVTINVTFTQKIRTVSLEKFHARQAAKVFITTKSYHEQPPRLSNCNRYITTSTVSTRPYSQTDVLLRATLQTAAATLVF